MNILGIYIFCMCVPTQIILKDLARSHDFDYTILERLAYCESRFDPSAIHVNNDGSKDRGLFQINDRWQDVSDECALNPYCATLWTINKIKKGGIDSWSCKI